MWKTINTCLSWLFPILTGAAIATLLIFSTNVFSLVNTAIVLGQATMQAEITAINDRTLDKACKTYQMTPSLKKLCSSRQ